MAMGGADWVDCGSTSQAHYAWQDPAGTVMTILLGIVGSIVGTLIGRGVGWYQEGQSAGFIVSLLGALLILTIYHAFRSRTA